MNNQPEETLSRQILRELGSNADIRLFRNSVAVGWVGSLASFEGGTAILQRARRNSFGLCPGSADLIGLRRIVVTQADVGRTLAVFLSLEVKTSIGRPSPEQIQWDGFVRGFGGLSGIVRDVDQARLVAGV